MKETIIKINKQNEEILQVGIITTIFALIKTALLLIIGPKIYDLFATFGIDLSNGVPFFTKTILQLANLLKNYWYMIIPLGFSLIVGFSIILGTYLSKQEEKRRVQIYIAYIILLILSVIVVVYSIYTPVYSLTNSLR